MKKRKMAVVDVAKRPLAAAVIDEQLQLPREAINCCFLFFIASLPSLTGHWQSAHSAHAAPPPLPQLLITPMRRKSVVPTPCGVQRPPGFVEARADDNVIPGLAVEPSGRVTPCCEQTPTLLALHSVYDIAKTELQILLGCLVCFAAD